MESLWRLARRVMALGGVAALLVLAPALNRAAWAQADPLYSDTYYVAYYDVASHSIATAAGYGGRAPLAARVTLCYGSSTRCIATPSSSAPCAL